MDDIYKILHDHIDEELDDAEEYAQLAAEAEADGCDFLAEALYRIARDEYNHADFHRTYLMAKGKYPRDTDESKWKKVEHILFEK